MCTKHDKYEKTHDLCKIHLELQAGNYTRSSRSLDWQSEAKIIHASHE